MCESQQAPEICDVISARRYSAYCKWSIKRCYSNKHRTFTWLSNKRRSANLGLTNQRPTFVRALDIIFNNYSTSVR